MRQQYWTEITFDRISTREELSEALDLICNWGKSEFTRKPDERGGDADSVKGSPQASTSLIANDACVDSTAGEIMSLTDLFANQTERPN